MMLAYSDEVCSMVNLEMGQFTVKLRNTVDMETKLIDQHNIICAALNKC